MNRQRSRVGVGISLLVACLLGACGGGRSGATSSSPTVTVTTSTTAPTSDSTGGRQTTVPGTVAPAVQLPAGLQYDTRHAVASPFDAEHSPVTPIADDGTTWVSLGRTANSTTVQAAVTGADGQFALVPVDDGTNYAPPKGFAFSTIGFTPIDVAHGSSGFVAIGRTVKTLASSEANYRSVIWFSRDGRSWTRFDPRALIGEASLKLTSVVPSTSGFLVSGSMTTGTSPVPECVGAGSASSCGASVGLRGVVLRSPDGVTWSKLAEFAAPFPVSVDRTFAIGEHIVAIGSEHVCSDAIAALTGFSGGRQIRLWVSDDNGSTFTSVDPSAGGLIRATNSPPTDPGQCSTKDPNELERRYATTARLVGAAGDRLVVVSADGTQAAVSTDGRAWTVAPLPGSTPAKGAGSDTPSPSRANAVTWDGSRLVLLSDEARRDSSGIQQAVGDQMLGWSSPDGHNWTALPVARPITQGDADSLTVLSDGSVLLGRTHGTALAYVRSEPGALIPFDTCMPTAAADCSFVNLHALKLAGKDLAAIDFSGAFLDNVDLSGANLAGADFDFAQLVDSSLANAAAADASFFHAQLEDRVLLDGADVDAANFLGAQVGASLLKVKSLTKTTLVGIWFDLRHGDSLAGASFAGLDLTQASFDSLDGGVDMTGVDFAGATLAGVSFRGVDLTGATFAGAKLLTSVRFDAGVVCPDGAPVSPGTFGPKACRL